MDVRTTQVFRDHRPANAGPLAFGERRASARRGVTYRFSIRIKLIRDVLAVETCSRVFGRLTPGRSPGERRASARRGVTYRFSIRIKLIRDVLAVENCSRVFGRLTPGRSPSASGGRQPVDRRPT